MIKLMKINMQKIVENYIENAFIFRKLLWNLNQVIFGSLIFFRHLKKSMEGNRL